MTSRPDFGELSKNLKSMQRIDPCATKVLDKATHSALYKFQTNTRSWEKTDIGGTMFIYQRADKPFYSIMIVNRQSLSDFVEPILVTTSITQDKKFIFMKKSDGDIRCVWIFDEDECSRIFKLIEQLINDLKNEISPAEDEKVVNVSTPSTSESNNLLKMLQAAQTSASTSSERVKPSSTGSNSEMRKSPSGQDLPPLLQKLLIQKPTEPTFITADELEKDLVKDLDRTAIPKNNGFQDFLNSSSAVSLMALSTRSIHGSEADDGVESTTSGKLPNDESNFGVGSGSSTPPLDKNQFIHALSFLMQNDDQFVAQIHQAYVDALNRRLNLDR